MEAGTLTDSDREAIAAAGGNPDTEADLPGEGNDEQPEDQAVVVEGTEAQLSLSIGGSKPNESKVTLAGGEFSVAGQFKRGERVAFLVEGTIDAVEVRDRRDRKANVVTGTTRKHTLSVESIQTMPKGRED